jgi:hypothetical protein
MKHSLKKQIKRLISQVPFCSKILGSSLQGWSKDSSKNASLCTQSVFSATSTKYLQNFVQLAPVTQACQGAAALLHWSLLEKSLFA